MLATKTFKMQSGERYCLLVESSTGLPLFYPNLYLTSQVRNSSLSLSAMQSAASSIAVLLQLLKERDICLETQLRSGALMGVSELELIRYRCQLRNEHNADNIIKNNNKYVSAGYEYVRLTEIAYYLKWLAEQLVPNAGISPKVEQIEKMHSSLLASRPMRGSDEDRLEKSLDESQIEALERSFGIGADANPFVDEDVQCRNWLIYTLLFNLGIRGGELLNIRVSDIDFSKNIIHIRRRPDEQVDPRTDQPLVKTLARDLVVSNNLAGVLHKYIVKHRRGAQRARKHDYLLVTHKAGPTQGMPLTKSAYKKLIGLIKRSDTKLSEFSGHALRHTWNYRYSEANDSSESPASEAEQEKERSYLMGWKQGSGTAKTYNKRYVQQKAGEASLRLQEGAFRMPKGVEK
jgi:integrase